MNGHRITERREAAGLTQAGLSRKSGVSLMHLSAIERGVVHDLKASTALKLAGALGTTVDALLDDLGLKPEPEATKEAASA